MIAAFSITVLALSAGSAAGQSPDRSWKMLEAEIGHYSVEMPGVPDRKQETIDAEFGALIHENYVLQTDSHAFLAQFTAYPKGAITEDWANRHLELAVNGIYKGSGGGEVISREDIEGAQLPGKRLILRPEGLPGTVLFLEIYYSADGISQFQVVSADGNPADPVAKRFFTSLKFAD